MTTFVLGCKDACEYTLDALSRFYERVQALPAKARQTPPPPLASISELATVEVTESARDLIGTYLESARSLGRVTADLHLALASELADANFAPEHSTPHSQRGWFQSMRNLTRRNLLLLNQRLKSQPPEIQTQSQRVLEIEPEILRKFRAIYDRGLDVVRIRIHGNYHLGQVLYTGKEFLIIDFEGEPSVALSERRLKRSPLRDVAGMVWSFHEAAHTGLLEQVNRGTLPAVQMQNLTEWARFWSRWVSAAFWRSYRQTVGTLTFLPPSDADLSMLLEAYLLRKAVHELGYDLNNRPDRVTIPLQGILELVNSAKTVRS
jgi:maltose alpha-D-glucosyltransferase/alpha-amylase